MKKADITFRALQFKPHPVGVTISDNNQHATLMFKNGFGVSVIFGSRFYSNGVDNYEVAILDKSGSVSYNTEITADVLGYIDIKEVCAIMSRVQHLPKDHFHDYSEQISDEWV